MRTTTLAGPLGAAFTLVALGAGTAFAQVTPPPSAPVPPPPSLRPGTTGTDKANGAPATTGPATTAVKGANYDTTRIYLRQEDRGFNTQAFAVAQKTLHDIESACPLVEHDNTLFAACDNTAPAARANGPTYVPQLANEWEGFTKRLAEADFVVHGKPRAIVVLNGGKVVAEASIGGVVQLKK
jgi:hypothetical protein